MLKIIAHILLIASTTGLTTEVFSRTLKGDTSCAWGSKECNRCVNDVKANFNAIETEVSGSYASKIRVRSYAYRAAYPTENYMLHRINAPYEHIQGIGRIAGLGNNEYFVFTHSTNSGHPDKSGALAVIRMGANQKSKGFELGDISEGAGKNQNINNRTVARTYSDSNHPGGLTTVGHYVFVADWCQDHGKYDWCNTEDQYAFEVYDVSKAHLNSSLNSNPPIKIIDRSVYHDAWINGKSTASIAATRLESGYYLVAISRSGGKHYGFYLSSIPRLSRSTSWKLIDDEEIDRWAEGAAMINECGTGDIYQIQIERWKNGVFKTGKNKLHLYRLKGDLNKEQISYQYIKSRTFVCEDWCDFDKGGGIYVSPTGNLYLYATHAQQAKSTGQFRMVEFGNHKETGDIFDINWLISIL
jgi:hypothetical protein